MTPASYTVISLEPDEVDDDDSTASTHQTPITDRQLDRQAQGQAWYASLRSNTAAAVVIFVVTPLILISIGAPMVVPEYRVLTFRSFLVLTLCLLPATMWYLFIITRRASLLNDFVTSLNRLGLLQPMEYEGDGPARQRRVYAYLQKFEASYGPLSRTVRRNILDGKFDPDAPEERSMRATGGPRT